jgi:hypothetical protein
MKANEKRQFNTESPSGRPLPLKGSDYFPPGAGWNRGNRSDESAQPRSDDKQPTEPRRH